MRLSETLASSAFISGCVARSIAKPLFARSDIYIPEAPAENLLELRSHPNPQNLIRSSRKQKRSAGWGPGGGYGGGPAGQPDGQAIVNTIFSGVYPVVNVTWGNKDGSGQSFISFIDTGSSDTFVVADDFQCVDITTQVPEDQAYCGFGPLYNTATGVFNNISTLEFNISYFPELETLQGSMGYAPITVAGLTVPSQEVALVDYAAWAGDTYSSGLLGLAYPPITSAYLRSNISTEVPYDPWFITAVKEGVIKDAVFTISVDRVPNGTPVDAPAGVIAFGGLVPSDLYEGPWTSVPIEITPLEDPNELTWYSTTAEFLYGLANGTIVSGGTFQSIVDSGTAPCFVPTAPATDLNAQFVPPAVYNDTLGYWVVDCDAKAPYAAYKIGGKVMPIDPRDMIVPSLNGLVGYENVCFSAFGDGGDPTTEPQLIGEVWQHGYVIAYDQANTMLHFADRKPY